MEDEDILQFILQKYEADAALLLNPNRDVITCIGELKAPADLRLNRYNYKHPNGVVSVYYIKNSGYLLLLNALNEIPEMLLLQIRMYVKIHDLQNALKKIPNNPERIRIIHELGNEIKTNLGMLIDTLDEPGEVRMVKETTHTLIRLVNNITDLAGLEAGMLKVRLAYFQFPEMLMECQELTNTMVEYSGAECIVADSHKLKQIISILDPSNITTQASAARLPPNHQMTGYLCKKTISANLCGAVIELIIPAKSAEHIAAVDLTIAVGLIQLMQGRWENNVAYIPVQEYKNQKKRQHRSAAPQLRRPDSAASTKSKSIGQIIYTPRAKS